jgi:hypothetical protein
MSRLRHGKRRANTTAPRRGECRESHFRLIFPSESARQARIFSIDMKCTK